MEKEEVLFPILLKYAELKKIKSFDAIDAYNRKKKIPLLLSFPL